MDAMNSRDKERTELQPMLEDWEEGTSDVGTFRIIKNDRPRFGRTHVFTVLLVVFLVASNVLWWLKYSASTASSCVRPQLIYSPAKSAISYERKTLWRNIDGNVYTGSPRPELDQAWGELLRPMAIRLTRDELETLGEKSLALKDGSGFLAELTVFHELHCIKRIRRHLHFDYYYRNLTDDEMTRETAHMDHCLEYWREAAMCRGDITLATFVWHEGRPFSKVNSDNECVNWEKLRAWAESRTVDLANPSIVEPFHAQSQ